MSKVSVIIPVYNAPVDAFEFCIKSLLKQTFDDVEFIFVNDGSTDRCIDVLKKYQEIDQRIKIVNQKNQGVSVARNRGIDEATSPFVMFVDADDYLEQNAIELAYDQIVKADAEIGVFGAFVDDNGTLKDNFQNEFLKQDQKIKQFNGKFDKSMIHQQWTCWNKIYKKDFLNKWGIRFPVGIKACEDGVFNLLILLNNPKYVFIQKNLYYYRSAKGVTSELVKYCIGYDFEAFRYLIAQDIFKKQKKSVKIMIVEKFLSGAFWYLKKNPQFEKYYDVDLAKYKKLLNKIFKKKDLLQIKNYNVVVDKKCRGCTEYSLIYLFNFIPIAIKLVKNSKTTYSIFCIPVYKIKQNEGVYKHYFFGIQIFTQYKS